MLQSSGRGCTIIKGNLEIIYMPKISDIHDYLNKYLGDVEEIHGSLIINRLVQFHTCV